jgi:hypothetical protein
VPAAAPAAPAPPASHVSPAAPALCRPEWFHTESVDFGGALWNKVLGSEGPETKHAVLFAMQALL